MLPQLRTPIPGPRSRELAARLRCVESRNVTCLEDDFPIFWERASGTNVWDADGNRFLDLTSGFAVAGLGYGSTALVAAMQEQAATLYHAMGDVHPTELKVRLCEMLSAITFERWQAGAGKTILANSGSEAIEAALKTALLWSGRRGVLAFEGAYHGLGYGALETSGWPFFRDPFRAQLANFATLMPFPGHRNTDLRPLAEKLEAALSQKNIGAILVEPAQGRAGEIFPPPDFLPLLRRLCDAHRALLILDEIYTGFHRTGALFACEHTGTVPDLVCLGKGLTSGFPLSACVGRAAIMDAWPPSTGEALHTSTFLGNPLGCRMALESIRQHLLPETRQMVRSQGQKLKSALQKIASPCLGEVRGTGLMLGLEIISPDGSPDPAACIRIVKQTLQAGLLLLGGGRNGHILSFTPPFTISDEEIAYTASVLQKCLSEEQRS